MQIFLSTRYCMLACVAIALVFVSCTDDDDTDGTPPADFIITPGADAETSLQAAFLDAQPGDIIEIKAGTYPLTQSLLLNGKNDITIRGEGRETTILDFTSQSVGAEGILAQNLSNLLLKDFSVKNTPGDAIKVKDATGVAFINVGGYWDTADSSSGAYGLYPVNCNHVLMDGCYAAGASDAGIYVGQSNYVIVRNSTAERNVAGIEIENTTNADVYNNVATDNTGGLLIFDLPGLVQVNGGTIRAWGNRLENNNRANFAPPGNIVGNVPAGTGLMILAAKDIRFYDNQVLDNHIAPFIIISYEFLRDLDSSEFNYAPPYNPYTGGVAIYDNTITKMDVRPDAGTIFGAALQLQYDLNGYVQEFLYDGIEDPADENNTDRRLCIRNNDFNNGGTARFVNFNDPVVTLADYDCSLSALPEVTVDTPENE